MVDYEFMHHEDWCEFDYQKRMFVLKDGAPEEAKESYREYLETEEFLKKHPEISL